MKDVKQDLGSERKIVDRFRRFKGYGEYIGALQSSWDIANPILPVERSPVVGRREAFRARRRGQGNGTAKASKSASERDDRRADNGAEKKRLVKRHRKISELNKGILEEIRHLKAEHPVWGFRRIWAYLKFQKKLEINRKRIWRLMKENSLLVEPNRKLKARRQATTHKLRSIEPNSLWGTDMTKIMTNEGWAYLHVVLDWGSKKLVGCTLSRMSKTADWLDAINEAVNMQFPNGIKDTLKGNIYLVSDHGSQPTAKKYMDSVKELGFQQVFCSYCNPKGNADTERIIRSIKEDLIWPREWHSFHELSEAIKKWQYAYNEEFPHSTLGYDTPCSYEKWYLASVS